MTARFFVASDALDARRPAAAWELPDSDEKLLDVLRNEFRIRFAKAWTGRISAAVVLSAKNVSSLDSSQPAAGADYCVWLPGAASSSALAGDSESIVYSVTPHDQDGQTATSIVIDMAAPTGIHLGRLQCFFPHATSALSLSFGRWTSTLGDHLTLEVRP